MGNENLNFDNNFEKNTPYTKESIPRISSEILFYKRFDKKVFSEEDKKNAQNISFYTQGNDKYYKENNILGVPGEYCISDINEKNKYSEGYSNCVGIILIGIDKNTGKRVSLITHQKPSAFLDSEKFKNELQERLKEFVSKSELGTTDAVMLGGNKSNKVVGFKEYKDSIKTLDSISSEILGFEPRIITGPNLQDEGIDVFVETLENKIYICAPEQKYSFLNEGFDFKDLNSKIQQYEEAFAVKSAK